jgi:hypothetical protein
MDENKFLSLMNAARVQSYRSVEGDYWHGYQRGLRRGYLGPLFGSDAEHQEWMRLADDGTDKPSRERGRGYRDGLRACGVVIQTSPAAEPPKQPRRTEVPSHRGYTNRR